MMRAVAASALFFAATATAASPNPPEEPDICALIAVSADAAGLPRPFFARLIWKESRFDPRAVSPAGARGIAQFMPATAERRGLGDPFDPVQALPASAIYLGALRDQFGSLGLAAAAYNAGEDRVRRFLAKTAGLPAETREYVFSITGERAEWFRSAPGRDADVKPLDPQKSFLEACRQMPVIATRADPRPPWGVVVAGGRNRRAAIAAFERARRAAPSLINGDRLVLVRKPQRATGPVYTARLGFDSRSEARRSCLRLQSVGMACYLRRN